VTGHRFGLLLSRDGTKAGRAPGRRAAALAAAVVLGGGMWLTVPAASAESAACGTGCVNLFNQKFGTADVAAVPGGAATAGWPVFFSGAEDSTTEDWTGAFQGRVSDFYAAGLMNATLNKYYGPDRVVEIQYAPGGIDSGLCLGAGQNTLVTLQPCGLSAGTAWILDTADANGGYTPFISGVDTQYPAPYVLTANTAGDNMTTQAFKTNPGGAVGAQEWKLASGDWADWAFCSKFEADGYIGVMYRGVAACGNSDATGNNQGPIYYTTPGGTTVYFDSGPEPGTGFQCVELAARYFYFETTQDPPASPNGREFVATLHKWYPSYSVTDGAGTSTFSSSLTAGNIISMWSSNARYDPTGNGHVAVVTLVDVKNGNGTIYLMEENGSTHLIKGPGNGPVVGNAEITVTGGHMKYNLNYGYYDQFQWTMDLPGSG
jgi:hypothetical protein